MAEAKYKNMWTFLIESNYGDAADIDSDMRCTICTRILINAHSSVCGCRYCLECVKAYLNSERRFCPGNTDDCKVEQLDIDINIAPDHAMNYRISKLAATCRYSCGFRCELRNMDEHEKACQRQSVDCPYVNVGCRKTRLVTDRINEHLVGENYSHARLLMTCIDRLESESASMKRDTVELRSEIAEMRLARQIDEARARETKELMDQIKQEVANLSNEINMAKKQNSYLDVYRMLFFLYVLIICGCVTKYVFSNDRLMELQININLLAIKSDKVEQEMRIENEELHRNINEGRKNQTIQFDNVEMRVQNIETKVEMQNQKEFLWPIGGWAAKTESAKTESAKTESAIDGSHKCIDSDAFYSHKNGYKMCLSVCPNGNGVGKGTHLSVFFKLMRGPFDNILPWPFRRIVALSLIDQHTGLDRSSSIIRPENFPKDDNWNKPSSDRSNGFGEPKLIALSVLSTNPKLCQDDQIFIKCVVK